MFQFGIGALLANPTTGNLAALPNPQKFGTLQDVDVEISQKLEKLMGQNKFPDDIAPGDMAITGKAAIGNIQVDMFNQMMFAPSAGLTVGVNITALNEAHSVPASSPYTITVINSTTFKTDLGVWYVGGDELQRVTSVTAAGQYSVSAGVYTFFSGDASASVLITYEYTSASTGKTMTAVNQLQGYGPVFEIYLWMPYQGSNGMHLYACRSSKMSLPLKRSGYAIPAFDFEAFASPAGNVLDIFQTSN
jgi:hypothetical protein